MTDWVQEEGLKNFSIKEIIKNGTKNPVHLQTKDKDVQIIVLKQSHKVYIFDDNMNKIEVLFTIYKLNDDTILKQYKIMNNYEVKFSKNYIDKGLDIQEKCKDYSANISKKIQITIGNMTYLYIYETYEGENLKKYFEKNAIHKEELCTIMSKIDNILRIIASKGYVYTDVKFDQFVIEKNNDKILIKIIDFDSNWTYNIKKYHTISNWKLPSGYIIATYDREELLKYFGYKTMQYLLILRERLPNRLLTYANTSTEPEQYNQSYKFFEPIVKNYLQKPYCKINYFMYKMLFYDVDHKVETKDFWFLFKQYIDLPVLYYKTPLHQQLLHHFEQFDTKNKEISNMYVKNFNTYPDWFVDYFNNVNINNTISWSRKIKKIESVYYHMDTSGLLPGIYNVGYAKDGSSQLGQIKIVPNKKNEIMCDINDDNIKINPVPKQIKSEDLYKFLQTITRKDIKIRKKENQTNREICPICGKKNNIIHNKKRHMEKCSRKYQALVEYKSKNNNKDPPQDYNDTITIQKGKWKNEIVSGLGRWCAERKKKLNLEETLEL